MQNYHILRKSKIANSYKNERVKGVFDIQSSEIIYERTHTLPIDEFSWKIGVICGNSGSGKSLLASEIAKKNNIPILEKCEWDCSKTLIENFNCDIDIALQFLSKVGLNSQPSYLKPYNVLSNGEKMRVDIAKAVLENDFVIIDEFTSVIDREIAKIVCECISKLIREKNKKVIFVSCHKDYFNYLQPDWIYDVDTQIFKKDLLWQKQKREFFVVRGEHKDWEYFKQYHYLSSELNKTSKCFLLIDSNQKKIGFIAFLFFPNRARQIFRIHRLVIHPDYQGIGLGNIFLNSASKCFKEVFPQYKNAGIRLSSSLGRFTKSLEKNPQWRCEGIQASSIPSKEKKSMRKTRKNYVVSFEYIGDLCGKTY